MPKLWPNWLFFSQSFFFIYFGLFSRYNCRFCAELYIVVFVSPLEVALKAPYCYAKFTVPIFSNILYVIVTVRTPCLCYWKGPGETDNWGRLWRQVTFFLLLLQKMVTILISLPATYLEWQRTVACQQTLHFCNWRGTKCVKIALENVSSLSNILCTFGY